MNTLAASATIELRRVVQFLLIPLLLLSANYLDNRWRVIVDFKILQQSYDQGAVTISGVMNKQRRGCRFVEVTATNQNGYTVPVVFADLRDRSDAPPMPLYSRAGGPQQFGPWVVYGLRPDDAVELEARHYCHILWDHTETLTSFLVKPNKPLVEGKVEKK